jgi:hypothetical protein
MFAAGLHAPGSNALLEQQAQVIRRNGMESLRYARRENFRKHCVCRIMRTKGITRRRIIFLASRK